MKTFNKDDFLLVGKNKAENKEISITVNITEFNYQKALKLYEKGKSQNPELFDGAINNSYLGKGLVDSIIYELQLEDFNKKSKNGELVIAIFNDNDDHEKSIVISFEYEVSSFTNDNLVVLVSLQ